MGRSSKYLKRKDAIAYIHLQARVFDRLVRAGKIERQNRNGMECYERAQLDKVRHAIDNPERKGKIDWIRGILDGISGNTI